MNIQKKYNLFCPKNRDDWRSWLAENYERTESIWVVIFKKGSGKENLTVMDVNEEALCFGWIDSVPGKIDDLSYKLLVSPRKPKSPWSAINKSRVEKLIKNNQMTIHGLNKIRIAKENGSWIALEKSDKLEIPEELTKLLKKNLKANQFFKSLSPGSKKIILEWIGSARTAQTRGKRIKETVELASKGIRANHFRDLKKLGVKK